MLIRSLQALCLLIQVVLPLCSTQNVGSVFYNKHRLPSCWDDKDLARLRARKAFNSILPKTAAPNDVDGEYVHDVLGYFRTALDKVEQADKDTRYVLKETLADTIGGFLRAEMLPNAKYAFYAGNINYEDVNALVQLFNEIKEFLNTKGNGWVKPRKLRMSYNFNVDSIDISPGAREACAKILTSQDENNCIKIPMPKLDDKTIPSAIAIPWRKNALIGLSSKKSSQILVHFYKIAAECILKESPLSCRHSAFLKFNKDLYHWTSRDVAPHLEDEKWYVGFGGVLRVGATAQSFWKSGDGIGFPMIPISYGSFEHSRRSDRHKDELFPNSNAMFLIQLVAAIAVGIWLFLYMLTFFYRNRWNQRRPFESKEEDNIERTVMAASGRTSYSTEAERKSNRSRLSKSVPVCSSMLSAIPVNTDLVKPSIVNTLRIPTPKKTVSVRTENVFDLNEQKMKEMPVPVGPEVSANEPLYLTQVQGRSSQGTRSSTAYSSELTSACRSTSPPRLETSMSQFQVKKPARSGDDELRLPIYSTSECSASRSIVPSKHTSGKAPESLSSSVWTSSSCTAGSSQESQGPRGARRAVARMAKDIAKRIATRHRRSKEETAAKSGNASRSSQKTTAR